MQAAVDEDWCKRQALFVPIHALVEKLGSVMCNLLPAFHSLTGCDTTSEPYLIGKKKVVESSEGKSS